MLEQTLAELDEAAAALDEMVVAWRNGELDSLRSELLAEFEQFPGLYETLVTKRNSAWVPALERMLSDGRRHLVVVGALHLARAGQCHRAAPLTRARRRTAALAALRLLDLDHLEVFFARAAIRTPP